MLSLVTIQDKMLNGEPEVALAVVDAPDIARSTIEQLADRGRGRCVPHAKPLEVGKFYRMRALIRLPQDLNQT